MSSFFDSSSNAAIPATELPKEFNPGDHTATVNLLGNTAKTVPDTPDFPGIPTL